MLGVNDLQDDFAWRSQKVNNNRLLVEEHLDFMRCAVVATMELGELLS
jgi:hypothetical protein